MLLFGCAQSVDSVRGCCSLRIGASRPYGLRVSCSAWAGRAKRVRLQSPLPLPWMRALLERFPKTRVVATPNTVKVMRKNASPEALDGAWKPGFPGQIPDKLVIAEELEANVIDLEGNELVVVELGHTDTDHTTCLHVPSIGLVVAGDAVYNDVHLYLAESNAEKRQEWIAALNKIESLKPRAVVASHKRPQNDDSPRIIEETRQYIRDFDRLVEKTKTAQELYDKMLELYPNRVNPGWALWSSARAAKA